MIEMTIILYLDCLKEYLNCEKKNLLCAYRKNVTQHVNSTKLFKLQF